MAPDIAEGAAKILAVLMTTPDHARLDVLAVAIRAAIDSRIVSHKRQFDRRQQPG